MIEIFYGTGQQPILRHGPVSNRKKMWSCPQQDTVWCHLANLEESVAQFKEPVTDTVPHLKRCSRGGKISF